MPKLQVERKSQGELQLTAKIIDAHKKNVRQAQELKQTKYEMMSSANLKQIYLG